MNSAIGILTLVFALTAGSAQAAGNNNSACIPPDAAEAATALLSDPGFDVSIDDPAGPMIFEDLALDKSVATFTLTRVTATEDADATQLAHVILRPIAEAEPGDTEGENFAVGIQIVQDTPSVRAAVNRAAKSILAKDSSDFYRPCEETPRIHDATWQEEEDAPPSRRTENLSAMIALTLLCALGIGAALKTRGR
jgi:hypothetical protein